MYEENSKKKKNEFNRKNTANAPMIFSNKTDFSGLECWPIADFGISFCSNAKMKVSTYRRNYPIIRS